MIDTLHIELTNRCNLKCPMCPRTMWPTEKRHEIDRKIFKNLQLDTFKQILAIGATGDALYYPYIKEFFLYAKALNPDVNIMFSTNGVGRSDEWWRKLPLYLPDNHCVIFGLDGTDNDTLNIYRVGSDYERVVNNMRTFVDAGGTAEWQFILFKHNEHQVDKAKELCKKYGVNFALRSSYHYSTEHKCVMRPKKNVESHLERSMKKNEGNVVCRMENNNEIFVHSDGRIIPCCFIPSRRDEIEKLTRGIIFNVNDYPIRKCISDHYINGILKIVNKSKKCIDRCRVPFEACNLERTKNE
jgi:MoaA/NifB/PqqE/SkfB family radical SAM enzyme